MRDTGERHRHAKWRMYKELKAVPQDKVRNFRNDMYVVSEALRLMQKIGQAEVCRGGCGHAEKL